MKSFQIQPNDAGQRLDKFVSKTLPSLPQSLLYKYLRLKRIKRNGKKAEISARLQTGDIVDMYIPDEFFVAADQDLRYDFLNAGKRLDILYEDDNILLLNKESGLLSHPDEGEYTDTLITRVQRYLYEKGEFDPKNEASFTPALANRIDRNTQGIVMAAKNAEALRILNDKIRDREIKKFYLCVLIGAPPKTQDTATAYMVKNEEKNMVKVYPTPAPGRKTMLTKYRVLRRKNGLSLVEVELLTGRTHQIRAHMAYLGCPLLGDGKYGRGDLNKQYGGYKKQLLCSYKTVFSFTTDAGILNGLKDKSFEIRDVPFLDLFD
ncbi:MAG: RluA family pseudouridine synthase [Clostridia bacterium]|nr:RluA family pseudouridine synthase [Clostridia bacterium]